MKRGKILLSLGLMLILLVSCVSAFSLFGDSGEDVTGFVTLFNRLFKTEKVVPVQDEGFFGKARAREPGTVMQENVLDFIDVEGVPKSQQSYPDLVISEVRITNWGPGYGSHTKQITIKNQGGYDSGPFSVNAYFYGMGSGEDDACSGSINNIAAGGSSSINCGLESIAIIDALNNGAGPQEALLNVTVDSGKNVVESNEYNNLAGQIEQWELLPNGVPQVTPSYSWNIFP